MIQRIYRFIWRKITPINYWKKRGLVIGNNCRLVGDISFGSEPYLINIGNHVSITNSKFITHDGAVWVFRDKYPEIDLFGRISIGNNVFIGINSIILPGTIVEDNCIIGAGSVVRGKLESNFVYAGQPIRKISNLDVYYNKNKSNFVNTKFLTSVQKRTYLLRNFQVK